ncbi:MAG TPA: GGDEF domain-containing protein, partial [bacterium]|nr:GGDEF domain-containing protein [bacterium]
RMVAQHLQQYLGDRAFRYGGEEFCAVFEDMEGAEALALAEAMREKLESRKFVIRRRLKTRGRKAPKAGDPAGQGVHITLSIGLACQDKKHPTWAEVLTRADQCLYQAKEKGRTRSVLAGAPAETGPSQGAS